MNLYDCTNFFNKFSRGHPDFKGHVKNARERNKRAPQAHSKNGFTALFYGDPPGNRTRDTLIKSQVLYRLS